MCVKPIMWLAKDFRLGQCAPMKLSDWLDESDLTRAAFAKLIEVSPSYITLLCSAEPAWPGRETVEKIHKKTHGDVTALDFYRHI